MKARLMKKMFARALDGQSDSLAEAVAQRMVVLLAVLSRRVVLGGVVDAKSVILSLIGAVDLIDECVESRPQRASQEDSAQVSLSNEMKVLLVARRRLEGVLGLLGVRAMETPMHLDYCLHDPVVAIPTALSEEHGQIVEVIRRGYLLDGKVLRQAMISFRKYTAPVQSESEQENRPPLETHNIP